MAFIRQITIDDGVSPLVFTPGSPVKVSIELVRPQGDKAILSFSESGMQARGFDEQGNEVMQDTISMEEILAAPSLYKAGT